MSTLRRHSLAAAISHVISPISRMLRSRERTADHSHQRRATCQALEQRILLSLSAPLVELSTPQPSDPSTNVKIDWTDGDSGLTNFYIFRSTGGTAPFSKVGTVGGTTLQYTDSTVTPSSIYYYVVEGYDGTNISPVSNVIASQTGGTKIAYSNDFAGTETGGVISGGTNVIYGPRTHWYGAHDGSSGTIPPGLGNSTVTLNVSSMPRHTQAFLEFSLYVIDAWQGNTWEYTVGGRTKSATYTNLTWDRPYSGTVYDAPADFDSPNHVPLDDQISSPVVWNGEGAFYTHSQSTCVFGITASIYKFIVPVQDNGASTMTATFQAIGLSTANLPTLNSASPNDNPTWGITGLQVVTWSPDPKPPLCSCVYNGPETVNDNANGGDAASNDTYAFASSGSDANADAISTSGTVTVADAGLSSGNMSGFGQTPTLTNQGLFGAAGNNGTAAVDSNQSYLAQLGTGTLALTSDARNVRYFDGSDTAGWSERFFSSDTLIHSGFAYIFTDSLGNVSTLNDFSSHWSAAQQGKLSNYVDANGNATSYTYNGTTGAIQQVTQTNGSSTETWSYIYYGSAGFNSGLLEAVTLSRTGFSVPVQQTVYRYYDGSTAGGNAGDLALTLVGPGGMAAPTATLATGGTLPVGTAQFYVVTAVTPTGEIDASLEVSATPTTGNQTTNLSWSSFPTATSYKVYRNTGSQGEVLLASGISGTTYSDNGSVTLGTALPPMGATAMTAYRYWRQGEIATINGTDYPQPTGFVKSVFDMAAYARAMAAGYNPATATDAQLSTYAAKQLAYYDGSSSTAPLGSVASQSTQGNGTDIFTYPAISTNVPGYNSWTTESMDTRPDGSTITVYSNFASEPILKVFYDSVSGLTTETFDKYDSSGRLLWTAQPSAISGYSSGYADLVNDGGMSSYVNQTSGLIQGTDYYMVGWNFTGTGGIASNGSSIAGSLTAPGGTQMGYLSGGAIMTQTVNVSSTTGTLTLGFQAAESSGTQTLQVTIDPFTASSQTLTLSSQPGTGWTSITASITALAVGMHTIQIQGLGTGTAVIDSVTLTGTNAPALSVPGFESPNLPSGMSVQAPLGSTATSSSAGGVNGYVQDTYVRNGETGSKIYQDSKDYIAQTATAANGGATVYEVADDTTYGNNATVLGTAGNDARVTAHRYNFRGGTTDVLSETTINPPIAATQNGPATSSTDTANSDVSSQIFDAYGRTIDSIDGDGYVDKTTYDPATGAVTQSTVDASSPYAPTVLSLGSIGYWRLGESTGTTAADQSGNSLTGTYTGTVTLGQTGALTGDSDTSASFNGSTAFVNVPVSSTMNTPGFSVSGWAKWSGSGGTFQNVASTNVYLTSGWALLVDAGYWHAVLYGSGSTRADISGPAATTAWAHVALTYNPATSVATLYVNGTSAGTATFTTYVPTTTAPLRIGASQDGGGVTNYYFSGGLDDVSLYGAALSTGQVQNLYSAGVGAIAQRTHLNLTTTTQVDGRGRPTKVTDPDGNFTYTVYNDTYAGNSSTDLQGIRNEVRVYHGWNTTTNTPTGPIEISREYLPLPGSGGVVYSETLTSSATPTVSSGVPTGQETISAANIQSLSRSLTNNSGQIDETDAYSSLAGLTYSSAAAIITGATAGTNTAAGNYSATFDEYDSEGRQNHGVDANGTITDSTFNGLGQVTSISVGTNDTTSNNMVDVQDNQYDGGSAGDGNLTQVTQHVGGSQPDRVSQSLFDWRDRQVETKQGVQSTEDTTTHRPIMYFVLDNQGETTETDQYDGDTIVLSSLGSTNGVPNAPSSSLLRAKSTQSFDDQGRVYLAKVWNVDQGETGGTAGTVSGATLNTNSFFDHRGDVIAESDPGGTWTKHAYNGAGWDIKDTTSDGGQLNSANTFGTSAMFTEASGTTNDIVLEQTLTSHDNDGNPTMVISRQRFDSDPTGPTGEGDLAGPGGGNLASRDYYSGSYYDNAERMTASVNVGTNGGSAWSMPTSVPSRSSTVLVTGYGYLADNVQQVTINGSPTGGTFTLTFNGQTTSNIAWNASGLGVESALQALSSVGTYNVLVTGPAGGPYLIEFGGTLGGSSQPAITANSSGLTGGTPSIAIVTTQPGGDAGRQQTMTDPRGIVSQSDMDLAGRTTRSIADFVPGGVVSAPTNQTTDQAYDGNGDVLLMTADQVSGVTQQTAYIYGVGGTAGTNLFSNDLIAKTEYPDKTTGVASTLAGNDQTLGYDWLGEKTSFTDQNGSVHGYNFDVLARLTADIVTTFGSGVNNTVKRLGYSFDTGGRPFQQTSFTDTGGTSIVNQVQDVYNGYGQLVDEYQSHLGAVNTSTTPKVVYGFAQPTGANYSRPTSMTYPDGRTVDDLYGGTSAISAITYSGTTATVTTDSANGFAVGSKVTIAGASPSVYDGTFSVASIISATQFTVTLSTTPTANASGTDISEVASQQVPITAITHSGTTASVTTGGTHGLNVGSSITIQGASDPIYDGTFTVTTIVSSTQFKYTLPGTPAANAVGVDMVAIVSTAATLDGTISRLTGMQDHVDGTILESYQFLGSGTIVQKNRPQPGVDLAYIQQTSGTGDAGDKYTGLDRFGRVDDQNWVNPSTGTSTDNFGYGYDQDSNVLYRNNIVNTSFGELYHTNAAASGDNNTAYDGLGRLTAFRRGTLSASSYNSGVLDTVTTLNSISGSSNAWSLDALGNATTTGGATQTFNAQDQITAITGKTSPVYDNNGNMKTDESGNTYTFDAWNRMIEAQVGSTQEFYSYDADNRRPGLSICSGAVSDSYYTTGWQDIEDDVVPCAGTTTKSTYVWSESYVDDLVARDQSTNNGPVTRIYAQQDANHDTTSLVNASGTVLERFVYDPYGNRTVLTPSTWAVTSDSQSWVYGFQGGRLDPLTNKINFRNRDLDTGTDTWMEKDPAGYIDSSNPYQFVGSNPVIRNDALGLTWRWIKHDGQNENIPVHTVTISDVSASYLGLFFTTYGRLSYGGFIKAMSDHSFAAILVGTLVEPRGHLTLTWLTRHVQPWLLMSFSLDPTDGKIGIKARRYTGPTDDSDLHGSVDAPVVIDNIGTTHTAEVTVTEKVNVAGKVTVKTGSELEIDGAKITSETSFEYEGGYNDVLSTTFTFKAQCN